MFCVKQRGVGASKMIGCCLSSYIQFCVRKLVDLNTAEIAKCSCATFI